ncbi:MAG: DUF1887 family CARF protein [Pseudomonadota bacterium]|jgi:hypothetical protein
MTIPRYDTHICLVSAQATPNFIPALDSRFRPKEVILLVSVDMQERARWLETVLKQRGIAAWSRPISDPWSVTRTQEEILDVLLKCDGKSVALNVTGGTKLMAIAAQDVFREARKPVFYVHPERNEIVPLFSDDERFVIEERVKLPDYLSIHGYRELGRDTREFPARLHILCEEFIKDVERFAKPLRALNSLAHQAKGSLRARLVGRSDDAERVRELLAKLDRYGLAKVSGDEIVFLDENARFFANGGWLEVYVAGVVSDLPDSSHIQDVARSLKVESAGKARNEIDVALLVANRLFLIECKTKYLNGQGEEGPGAEMLYKLDSLAALGGLNTRGAIVSFQTLKHADRQRAKDLGIKIIEGGQLRNLGDHLRNWMMPGG